MKIIETLKDAKFLKLNKIVDEENNVSGYLYAERLGVDSVAFICCDIWKPNRFLVNKEYKPPISDFVTGAFGGSLDKDSSLEEIVIDEVREEAGFEVSKEDVIYVGKSFVSTQMNQFCHLFLVNVDSDKEQERKPENAIEAMAETSWMSQEEIRGLDDWKAIAILAKSYGLA